MRRVLDKSRQDRSVDERIAVSLRFTGIRAGLLEFVALARALALGGDPTPPS